MSTTNPARPGAEAAIIRAEARCKANGARLTDGRRSVLRLILEAERPLGAYDLLKRLGKDGSVAPPTVYRALEFLLAQGLVHRINALAAFAPCSDLSSGNAHAHQLLVCRRCGTTTELNDPRLEGAIGAAADAVGFLPDHGTMELQGRCAACRDAP